MKWPKSISLIRHAQSEYNTLRDRKSKDPEYQRFKKTFEEDHQSPETLRLAEEIRRKYALSVSDYETPLTKKGERQAIRTGEALIGERILPFPDVIFYSPYLRTVQTLEGMTKGWGNLALVLTIADDRIREQEHGLSLLYSDWRLFHVFHPEQKLLRDLLGPYWYTFPQGESVSQVRDRARSMVSMLIREWAEKNVWLVTHHITILSIRANLEHLTPEEFIYLDEEAKPVNCGLARYQCVPSEGKDGKMFLMEYNRSLIS